jgi:membrane protein required for colicin V production
MGDSNLAVSLTWIDWAILFVLVMSVVAGLAQGFFRSVCSLGGLVLGLALAAWNFRIVAAPLQGLVRSEEIADIIGFLLIALVVMAIAGILGNVLAKTLRSIGLGCLDRIAGGVFGLFQGALLVTLAILVTVAFYPEAHWLVEARLPRHFFAACHLSTHISPDQLAQRVRTGLRRLETETPVWLHPHQGKS